MSTGTTAFVLEAHVSHIQYVFSAEKRKKIDEATGKIVVGTPNLLNAIFPPMHETKANQCMNGKDARRNVKSIGSALVSHINL